MVSAPVPPAPNGANPDHAAQPIRKLVHHWKHEADKNGVYCSQPLDVLLLAACTIGADEGPGLDVLIALHETIDGLQRAAGDVDTITVGLGDVRLMARRLELAMELIRRGAGAFER